MRYEPYSPEDAASIIGEGVHTGLRKGTDAPESAALWNAISNSDRAWTEAIQFAVDGLDYAGIVLCRKVRDE